MFRLDYVQNNTYSVLVVVPNQALICVGCVCSYDPVTLKTTFSCLVIWDYDSNARLQCEWHFLLRILKHHLICVKHSQRLYLCRLAGVIDNLLSDVDILPIPLKQIL